MFKHYFERIENVETGPLIALIFFFLFFLVMIVWIFKLDRRFINKMKNLPLEEENIKSNKE
jgi:cbb3-type cytochrome oxidase subunit 3